MSKHMIEERMIFKEFIHFVKPLLGTTYIDYTFFNATTILSGRYSKEYILTSICFQMTNELLFKGILGLAESVVSFCGTSFGMKNYSEAK